MTEPAFETRAPQPVPRIDSLTGLRFLAAAAVVAFHVGRYVEPMSALRPFTGLGYSGVGFFFVLSGFVLAWSARPGISAGRFYWNRFARVWPLHALTTAVAAIPFLAWQGTRSDPVTLVAVLLLLQAWWPYAEVHYAFNGVSWSLSCEAFFYAVFPLFAYRAMRQPVRRLLRLSAAVGVALVLGAVIALLVLPPAAWSWALYVNPSYRLGEFVIGVMLACAVRSGLRVRLSLRGALFCTLVVHALLLVITNHVTGGDLSRVPLVVTDLVMLPAFCLVVVAAAGDVYAGRPSHLAGRTWVRLGEWSFALYLVHELALRWLGRMVSADWPVATVQTVVVVSACVVLSGLLHHGVERPVEQRLKRLRRSRPQADVPGRGVRDASP